MALIAQLREHCTFIVEVVGSNPVQSLNFFSGLCSGSVAAALALMTVNCLDLQYKVTFDGMASLELYVMKEFLHLLFLLIGTFR